MLDRITDASQSRVLRNAINQSQVALREAQTAAASGKRAQRYEGIASEAGVLLRSEHARGRAEMFVLQDQRVLDRLNAMEGALGSVNETLEAFRTTLFSRLNDVLGDGTPLQAEAEIATEALASSLNLRLDGRYLFAGSRADRPAVELPDVPITQADPTLYYQGDDVVLAARIDEHSEVQWGVTADRGPFAAAFAAIGEAQQADAEGSEGGLQAALVQLEAAIDGVADIRGEIGANAAKVDDALQNQRATSDYLDQTIKRIEDVDLADAISEVARQQVNLEAAYLMTRSLNELSLADFIR